MPLLSMVFEKKKKVDNINCTVVCRVFAIIYLYTAAVYLSSEQRFYDNVESNTMCEVVRI